MARRTQKQGVLIAGFDGVDQQMLSADSSGNLATTANGGVASGATDSGNPVKVGGVYNSTKPTLTNGQRGDAQLGTRGGLNVNIHGADNSQGCAAFATNVAGQAYSAGLSTVAFVQSFNGSTYDPTRGNTDITVLASAARTATNQSADIVNYNAKGLHLVIDVTAAADTPSVVFTIQGKDALSGKYYTILASAAITGTGTTVLRVHPGLTAAANTVANDIIPRTWRVDATHADADSITYSIGASLIVG